MLRPTTKPAIHPPRFIDMTNCKANSNFVVAILLLLLSIAPSVHAASLSETLHTAAKDAIKHCKDNDIKSVGTLKFLIAEGDEFSDSVGTINSLLAKRLDVALVLVNNPRTPINLIEDASFVAGKIDGASHLSKEGRTKLFSRDYPTLWGDDDITPDALLTGIGKVSKDLQRLEFSLLIVTREDNALASIGDYVATTDAAVLTETGESFATRGAFDGGKVVRKDHNPGDLPDLPGNDAEDSTTTILTSAKQVRESSASHPLQTPSAAVRLQVLYDGVVVPFDFKDGRALLREPNEGQRVELVIQKDSSPAKYGVVVKVNGQNTLKKQVRPDTACGKWILQQPNQRVTIRGYQMDQQELEQFRVLSQSESKEREIDYGSEVGQISITVFAEGSPPKLELDEDAREAKLVEQAELPKEPSATFGALKAKLLADANRGLIAEGNRVQGQVQVVKFHINPNPIMSATAIYYQP